MNAADILKNHRQHYVTRLVSRNPLLKFLPSAYREDLTNLVKPEILELEIQIQPIEILKLLLAESPKPVKVQNALKKNLAKCTKIKNESDDYFHSTGQLSFYLGFPFIHVAESSRYQFSPLFLWAISCKITNDSITFERIVDEDGNPLEPQLNRIFQTWLNYENNVHLNWDNGENLTFDNIEYETKQALSIWHNCNSEFNAHKIQPIPDKEILKIPLSKAQVLPCAVIGYVPFKGQALLDDLDKLAEQLQNGESNKVLDYFLKPVDLFTDQENALKPKDQERWLITDYDHSQESVVWNTRKFDLMVLQGPPGTGKSQVIVNLIADALANKKKVLVVCQKKAALEVIRKRLTANGLGDLVQLIEEPQNDRMRIIKSIRAIDSNFSDSPTFIANERNKTSNKITQYEIFLDNINALLSENQKGKHPNYGNLKARLHQLAQDGIDAYGKLNLLYQKTMQSTEWLPDTQKELQALLQETEEFLQQYQSCNYAENPYRNLEKLPENHAELRGIINQVNGFAQSLENSDSDLYMQRNAWLAEHDWAIQSYTSFLSTQNRQTYENFRYLVRDTQKLNKYFPKNYIDALLSTVRNDKKITEYSRLKELSGSIAQVLFVKTKLNEHMALNFLFENSPEKIACWQKIIECFRFQSWIDDLMKQGDISKFAFEEKKNNLQQALYEKRNQDVKDILAKYSQRIQSHNDLSDANLLRLKKSSNAPKTTLRKLYNAGFESIHQLQPVLLTNPEGVSAILELTPNLYDLVIIDEASQMFMADALPILYRAKAAFLSGDTQQMPPSDFFSISADIENLDDEDSEMEDEDSGDKNRLIAADGEYCLLDAAEYAVKKGNPNHAMLSVHYRSEFKELIDFSNHAFYEGKLITAVSNQICPSVIRSPIELNVIENATAKSGANLIEAIAVVDRIAKLWEQQDTYSIGIITLNIKQKDQIDDLLFERGQQDSCFLARLEQERNRTKDGEDIGFFVRSVEHVQGDERDFIIFSTAYDGIKRNFGAISRKEKGRKRLNVAITRAKLGMIIYTSLNIDTISNENQRNETESYWFWQYMRYARAVSNNNKEMIQTILHSLIGKVSKTTTDTAPDSFFEEDVADFLRVQNYHVDYQIGESGFKIDLGIKHRAEDATYLCGIECDGRQYHSSWPARLNDIWRQNILENKGWKIVRIWSNDWFDNRKDAQEKLLKDLATLSQDCI
jgi:hypothetical protein